MDYSQKQQDLQNKANNILDELNLISHLSKIGKVNFVGSYSLGLMSWEDIDIEIHGKWNLDDYLGIVNYLFKQSKVYSLNIQDFRKSIFPNRPQGIYCGIQYLIKPDIFWKIDLWFMDRDENESIQQMNDIKSRLNESNKKVILRIKNEMRSQEWGKSISGSEVYKAVLDSGVTDTDEFKKYLEKINKK